MAITKKRTGKFGWLDAFNHAAPEKRKHYNNLWRIALELFQAADVDTLTTRPGHKLIAANLGIDPRTVTRQIDDLAELGWIALHERAQSGGRGKGKAKAAVYLLTIPERVNERTSLGVSSDSEKNDQTSKKNERTSRKNDRTSGANDRTSLGMSTLEGPYECPQESFSVTTLPPSADNSPPVPREDDTGQADSRDETADTSEDSFSSKDSKSKTPTERRCDNCNGKHATGWHKCPAPHGYCKCAAPLPAANRSECGRCRQEANEQFNQTMWGADADDAFASIAETDEPPADETAA